MPRRREKIRKTATLVPAKRPYCIWKYAQLSQDLSLDSYIKFVTAI
jgi:hypothetical protein